MKKFLLGIVILVVILAIAGGIFFLVDKGEYFSNGKTIFTINEEMGEGLTRRIGLGYVMYTRNTGFPTNESDNLISTWFNAVSRDQAIELLLGDDVVITGLDDEDSEVVKYYSQLIMEDLNKNASKFNLGEISTIYVNLNSFVNLKTGSKISASAITGIAKVLTTKLDNPELKIENKNFNEIEQDSNIYTTLLKSIKDGIYVDVSKAVVENQVDILIFKTTLNQIKTRYSYDINKLQDGTDYNIFTEIK